MQQPTRTAILIASQTPTGSHLEGIGYDVERMRNFLLSPFGGAWYPEEIKVLINPPRRRVLQEVQRANTDYVFTYFSGHGATMNKTDRKIYLSNGPLSDIQLFSPTPRQFIFVDACRTRVEPPRISGIGLFPEGWVYCRGHEYAREVFNHDIQTSPAGIVLYHSTKDNQYAYEDLHRKGGKCSLALLDAIHYYHQLKILGTIGYDVAFSKTAELLQTRQETQRPECVYQAGELTVPFALVSPKFTPLLQHKSQSKAWETILTVAGVGLFLYALSDR